MAEQEKKSLLRFLTCGSVDDGKSTLIGRLLYDTKLIFEDQLAALSKDSRKHGTTGEDIDFALLVDGLEAEREQGITIDVAYRFFARRSASSSLPTRLAMSNTRATWRPALRLRTLRSCWSMHGKASCARRGAISFIASLLGIRHIILAINKIDLVGLFRGCFERIVADYQEFASKLGFQDNTGHPAFGALRRQCHRAIGRTALVQGTDAAAASGERAVDESANDARPFRFPVQFVNRPNLDFRGFAGTIASGSVAPGDAVVVAKSGKSSRVKRIVTWDGDLKSCRRGRSGHDRSR